MSNDAPLRCGSGVQAAFTLLEVLVAAALVAMLAATLMLAAGATLRRWNASAGRLGTAAAARLVTDQVAQDLESAIFRSDGNVWLAATILPDTGNSGAWRSAAVAERAKPGNAEPRTYAPAAGAIEQARFGIAGAWLRFFTTKLDAGADVTELSAPVGVGYQIVRTGITSSATAAPHYLLFRAEVRRTHTSAGAAGTFESGYNVDPSATPGTRYQVASGTTGDPGNLLRPPLGAVIADDVIDFGVRLYVREGGALRLIFPAESSLRGGPPAVGTPAAALPPAATAEHLARSGWVEPQDAYRHAFPDVAEIMVRIMDAEGARLISAYEAGRLLPPVGMAPGDYWWDLAEAHSQVFTRRIEIRAKPL
jgi:prepilin-type N-terminal cleavage/methylation domain-containing protein